MHGKIELPFIVKEPTFPWIWFRLINWVAISYIAFLFVSSIYHFDVFHIALNSALVLLIIFTLFAKRTIIFNEELRHVEVQSAIFGFKYRATKTLDLRFFNLLRSRPILGGGLRRLPRVVIELYGLAPQPQFAIVRAIVGAGNDSEQVRNSREEFSRILGIQDKGHIGW